jgi:cell division protein FtsI (penicillin-binding protein 3)
MRKTRRAGRRLTLTMVMVFLVVIVFTGRLFQLQVVQAAALDKVSAKNQSTTVTTPGIRGSIVDSNGVVLAQSVDRFNVAVAPKDFLLGYYRVPTDKSTFVPFATSIAKIAAVTNQSAADLTVAVQKDPKSLFAYLDKNIDLAMVTKLKKLKIPGLYYPELAARSYPNGSIAGDVVGFVGTDGPQAGVELGYNSCLASTAGQSTYQTGADGVRIPGSTVKQTNPVNGGTLQLTVDRDLTYQVLQAITKQAQVLNAPWATAVVERVSDGHLMAVADYPTVDPNDPGAAKTGATGSLAFTQQYEPGSTFKAMSAAALIDAGAITPTTQVVVPPVLHLSNGGSIKDSFYHGTLHYTTAGVLENSSNIGISLLSEKLPAQQRYNYMVKFGVGQKTAVDFGGQATGVLPKPPWDPVTTKSVEFGQGVSATSVQVAQIFQTIANHGVREPSTLVEKCTKADGTVIDTPTAKPVRVVSAKAADEVRGMLETVVTGGPISSLLKIPGYRIAAKTGTAQVAKANGGGYGKDYIISVAGMIPAENPQYVVVVTFGPTTLNTSAGAAPAFKNVMLDVIDRYRIPPSTTPAPYVQTTW